MVIDDVLLGVRLKAQSGCLVFARKKGNQSGGGKILLGRKNIYSGGWSTRRALNTAKNGEIYQFSI